VASGQTNSGRNDNKRAATTTNGQLTTIMASNRQQYISNSKQYISNSQPSPSLRLICSFLLFRIITLSYTYSHVYLFIFGYLGQSFVIDTPYPFDFGQSNDHMNNLQIANGRMGNPHHIDH